MGISVNAVFRLYSTFYSVEQIIGRCYGNRKLVGNIEQVLRLDKIVVPSQRPTSLFARKSYRRGTRRVTFVRSRGNTEFYRLFGGVVCTYVTLHRRTPFCKEATFSISTAAWKARFYIRRIPLQFQKRELFRYYQTDVIPVTLRGTVGSNCGSIRTVTQAERRNDTNIGCNNKECRSTRLAAVKKKKKKTNKKIHCWLQFLQSEPKFFFFFCFFFT